ncbi:MAG: hypothetical protein IPJ86_08410 [Bacteroidetes bacterium]|jgi:hypothetical protein|nr:hypothetical protein [Bacteroidota bacterium]
MKANSNDDLKKAMDACVLQINQIMQQLEPAARLTFMNQLIVRIMPERKKPKAANEKIGKQQRKPLQSLSPAQMKLIDKLASDTENLFNAGGDHRA